MSGESKTYVRKPEKAHLDLDNQVDCVSTIH